jgi:hypothetical protein
MYERPGRGVYVTATKTTKHGDPCVENGLAGAAIKQKAYGWGDGYSVHEAAEIAVGERFHIRTKGIHQFSIATGTKGVGIAAATKGQAVYIRPADNTLQIETDAVATDLPFGRVVELVADNRGVPDDHIRIDLDLKDTIRDATT